jgi:hypothetical protein
MVWFVGSLFQKKMFSRISASQAKDCEYDWENNEQNNLGRESSEERLSWIPR